MKYKFIDKDKILPLNDYMIINPNSSPYIYANEDYLQKEYERTMKEYKELVVEEKPKYDEETQELYSWYEDGDVITQKFEIIEKTAKNEGI